MKSPRVLLTGPQWFGDLLAFCERGLIELGADVRVFPTNQTAWLDQASRLRRRLSKIPIAGSRINWRLDQRHRARLVSEINREFVRVVNEWHPDLVLSILCWGEPISSESLDEITNRRRVGWLMDDPFGNGGSLATLIGSFERVFAVDGSWVEPVQLIARCPVSMLTCGADLESHHRLKTVPEQYQCRIAFVGSSYSGDPAGIVRRVLLEKISDLNLHIYGDRGWRAKSRRGDVLSRCYQGGELSSEQANLAYNGADIALNIHHSQFRCGTSLRTFAICATGAFQMVDWRPGLDQFFVPDEEIVCYRSPDELRDKAVRYLGDHRTRRRIARAGYERVLREHTYAHRLAAILREMDVVPAKKHSDVQVNARSLIQV
jgi:spore maturation protein CgeB